jgi:hypothetical protein
VNAEAWSTGGQRSRARSSPPAVAAAARAPAHHRPRQGREEAAPSNRCRRVGRERAPPQAVGRDAARHVADDDGFARRLIRSVLEDADKPSGRPFPSPAQKADPHRNVQPSMATSDLPTVSSTAGSDPSAPARSCRRVMTARRLMSRRRSSWIQGHESRRPSRSGSGRSGQGVVQMPQDEARSSSRLLSGVSIGVED